MSVRCISTGESRDVSDGRLPRQVIPFHYVIELAPDFYGSLPFPFSGTVQISVRCDVATSSFILNYNSLTIGSVSITNHPESPVSAPLPGLVGVSFVCGNQINAGWTFCIENYHRNVPRLKINHYVSCLRTTVEDGIKRLTCLLRGTPNGVFCSHHL
jgi:hypothetical protein